MSEILEWMSILKGCYRNNIPSSPLVGRARKFFSKDVHDYIIFELAGIAKMLIVLQCLTMRQGQLQYRSTDGAKIWLTLGSPLMSLLLVVSLTEDNLICSLKDAWSPE